MTDQELDEFLREQRTCRMATVRGDGRPHVTPLWFVWDGAALWLFSVTRSQRWTDLERSPEVAVAVDTGDAYHELRGVELAGRVEVVGEVPRGEAPNPALAEPERLFGAKYQGGAWSLSPMPHAWLRLRPYKIVSWDFRKLP